MKYTVALIVGIGVLGLGLQNSEPDLLLAGNKSSSIVLDTEDLAMISTTTDHVLYNILYWYQSFPTVGLRLQDPFWPPPYPFIPHDYSLWELAPSKGEGVVVALLDNGVAGVQTDNQSLPYHPDVKLHPDNLKPGFNFVDRPQHSSIKEITVTEPIPLKIKKADLPIPQRGIRRSINPHVLSHGTHTYSLIYAKPKKGAVIGNGLCGIAPESKGLAIKICNEKGMGRLSTLLQGIKKARECNVDIINLSLSFCSSFDMCDTYSKVLHELESIPFTIVAAGNRSVFSHIFTVPFISVGSFAYEPSKVTIPSFSQYEDKRGPLFLAPGYNILGPLCDIDNPQYTLQHGTSLSASIMSGFFALMIGEFQHSFTRQEYEEVCKASSFKMYETSEWDEKSVYGIVDMRMALFMLHVLRKLRNKVHTVSFDTMVQAVRNRLLHDPNEYGQNNNISVDFSTRFMDYFIQAQVLKKKRKNKILAKEHAIHSVVNDVIKKL